MSKLQGTYNVAALHVDALRDASFEGFNCRVKRCYPKPCGNANICNLVEGSFVTECDNCDAFG